MSFDVNIQIVSLAEMSSGKFFSFGQKRSLGVRGIQKLMNMCFKYLLTPLGSNPLDLTEGTVLTSLIGSNITPADAQDILQLAVEKTAAAIQDAQRGSGAPSDERLLSMTITAFVAIPDAPGFAAQILVRNVAGQGLKLLLPTLEVL